MSGLLSIGVDPGKSGAVAFISDAGVWAVRNKETLHDISAAIREAVSSHDRAFAVLEKVHAMPKQGVSSTFKFGQSFGQLEGILSTLGVPFELVTPRKWQQSLSCLSGGDKNVTKARAQQLFPDIKIIHATADAYLLAEYSRRNFS